MKKKDVCIVGAGPAGTITALFLAKKGISCLLVDKDVFPRDKICGDGISGWVLSVLGALDPELLLKLNRESFLLHSHGIRVVAPNHRSLDLPFLDNNSISPDIPPGYICKRMDFDNFLIEEARNQPLISLLENTEIKESLHLDDGVALTTKEGEEINAEIVIYANGANSLFMKSSGGIHKDKRTTMTGLKTYYKGINGFHDKNYVELHFLKDILPGYFWIFPLPNGIANVGIGLDQYRISRKKINLKQQMLKAIEANPYLKERFKDAEQISPIQAYNLPLWSRKQRISGNRFMLAGDTASLIDPVTGEGIGHAALCGMFAADQAERALRAIDFSSKFMEQYDNDVYNKIGKELSVSNKIHKFIRHAWLFDAVVSRASKSRSLQDLLVKAMTDIEARKKLKEPWLYVKVLLGL